MTGQKIIARSGRLSVPDIPIIPYLPGDGIGPEIWQATQMVIDSAVSQAYKGRRSIQWYRIDENLPLSTKDGIDPRVLKIFSEHIVGIKGPLETPVGIGPRSLNFALRRDLDLYVCLRPVRWFPGVPAPVRQPERVDMVVFRENTEDLYAGIEFKSGSSRQKEFLALLQRQFPEEYARIRHPETSAIGVKPISSAGSKRIVRAAIRWALENKRKSVTLVHKGNVMKYTEGSFRSWGYEVARQEFGETTFSMETWLQIEQQQGRDQANQLLAEAKSSGKLIIQDRIADAMFAAALIQPEAFDVIATTNVNGDYLSDALAAQVGGLGLAPGANINFESGHAIFEATHGTAPDIAGTGKANPASLILSGEMMLRYLGWSEAADLLRSALEETINRQLLTADLAAQVPGSRQLTTAEFGEALTQAIQIL